MWFGGVECLAINKLALVGGAIYSGEDAPAMPQLFLPLTFIPCSSVNLFLAPFLQLTMMFFLCAVYGAREFEFHGGRIGLAFSQTTEAHDDSATWRFGSR